MPVALLYRRGGGRDRRRAGQPGGLHRGDPRRLRLRAGHPAAGHRTPGLHGWREQGLSRSLRGCRARPATLLARRAGTTHQQFIDDVKAGRGDRLADDERLFSGLIWSGEQALELGLVDRLDSLDGVARRHLEDVRLQNYTPRLDPSSGCLGVSGVSWRRCWGCRAPRRRCVISSLPEGSESCKR